MNTTRLQKSVAAIAAAFSLALPLVGADLESRPKTYCNPIDLPYRFSLKTHNFAGGKSAREAADPCMVFHKGVYWLFASKCGGYFRSKDLIDWEFIPAAEGFPVEDYAPAVAVYKDKWLMTPSAGSPCALYATDDPATGPWTRIREFPWICDPEIFVDDDERVYLFWGSSPDKPLYGVELDPENDFAMIGEPVVTIEKLDLANHGWESRFQFADDAEMANPKGPLPWMEGSTLIKHDGRYYLQYSAPATEMKEYADGVYVADKPLGPYRYQQYSPFSEKSTGFIGSAGHGCTIHGADGQFWRAATMAISVNFGFERRIGLFPAGFLPSPDGGPDQLVCNTYLADYPQLAPGLAKNPLEDNLAGWMLLSRAKKCKASSTLADDRKPENAFDEDVRTAWSAKTGDKGEWLEVDLGKICRIDAVQVNFADVGSKVFGHLNDAYRYRIEVSSDGKEWIMAVDMRENRKDSPHQYVQLEKPVMARCARLSAEHVPGGANFSVSDFRLFGSGLSELPGKVAKIAAERMENRRLMKIEWEPSENAEFYVVRFGTSPDRLTRHIQVYDKTSVVIPGLNREPEYYATVDAVNDSGIAKGTAAIHAKPRP